MLLTAAIVAALPVYVRPQIDHLRRADAILVLSGYGEDRYAMGLDLQAQDGHRLSWCLAGPMTRE